MWHPRTVKARFPLAAAVVIVLAAGVALAVVRPGDLAGEDGTAAPGPGTATSTTTTTASSAAPSPGADPGTEPATTTTTTLASTTTSPSASTTTTRPAPEPTDTTGSGDPGGGPPRLADTGGQGALVPLGLVLLLAALAARGSAPSRGLPPDE